MVLNKDDLSLFTILRQELCVKKILCRIIEPIDCKSLCHRISRHTVCYAQRVIRKMFMLLKQTYWVKKTDLASTEQFLKYPEKLIFRDRNEVIILLVNKVLFSCWKVQNLFVQIWTSITLDPVDRIRFNFQENLTIYLYNDLWNFIELFSELTNLLAKQKRYQFNWDTLCKSEYSKQWVGSNEKSKNESLLQSDKYYT